VGLQEYFNQPPWGIDVQRSYELITSIDEDGEAQLTNNNGEVVTVEINQEFISDALKFKKNNTVKVSP